MVSHSKFLWVFYVICLMTVPFCAHAQNIQDAVKYALRNHPAIKSAYSGYRAAEENIDIEKSGLYPQLSVSATGGRTFQDNATSRGLSVTRGAAYSGIGEGSLSVSQPIFDGFETDSRIKAAEARFASMNYTLLDAEEQQTIRVAEAYIEVMRVRHAMLLISEQIGVLEDYVARISILVDEGVADEAELQQSRDIFSAMKNLRVDYQGQYLNAIARYREASGLELQEGYDVPPSLADHVHKDIAAAMQLAKKNNALLQSAILEAKATSLELKAEEGQIYPDINSEVSYLKADKADVIGGEVIDARAVLRMNWSFSVGGRYKAAVEQKKYIYSEVQSDVKTLEGEIERDVEQAYANYLTLKEKMRLAEERVDLNEKLVKSYVEQFKGARIRLLSLMRGESQLFSSYIVESDIRFALLASEYTILARLGILKDVILNQEFQVKFAREDRSELYGE